MKIQHQLLDLNIFTPEWNVKHLFLGTFNPKGGDSVNYFYGRSRNQTWPTLSKIFKTELNPNNPDFFEKIKTLQIACMDMISSVEASEHLLSQILGNGYSDSKIINGYTKREYNTNNIINIIKKNNGVNVYSTWGAGANLKEWKSEIMKINQVKQITPLASPSLVARVPLGTNKIDYIFQNWENSIKL